MHLVTCESVRDRLGLPDVDRINDAICEALHGVTEQLEAELRTTFLFQSGVVDLYYVEDSNLRGQRFAEKFLLSRGIVDEGTNALQVEVAYRKINLVDPDLADTITDLRDTSEAVVDHADQYVEVGADRGVVTIQDFRLLTTYVRITYDAGIEADTAKTVQFKQTGTRSVPADLKELATLKTILELQSEEAVGGPLGGSAGSREQSKTNRLRLESMERRASVMLDKMTRYEPEAHDPVSTS